MVKHQKEKLYPSAREHRAVSQLRKNGGSEGVSASGGEKVRHLPFDCCALTLTPYQSPVCNLQGIMFDSSAILPHVLKYKTDPVTGQPMTTRDIIKLHMDKDETTGKWQCPVLNKPFADHTKIVAIRQSGSDGNEANVFSYEAVEELNLKPRNYIDLISGQKFRKDKDLIWLNDPANEELNRKREEASLLAQQQLKKLQERDDNHEKDNPNIRHSVTAQRILDKLSSKQLSDNKRKGAQTESTTTTSMLEEGKKLKLFHSTKTSDTSSSHIQYPFNGGSLTSTSVPLSGPLIDTHPDEATPEAEEARRQAQFDAMKRYKKKGYVKIHTTKGTLLVELHCDIVPQTTSNFLGLAGKGVYDGSRFHRCIRNFMIQGGKPASGKGEGKSLWGKPFSDEFDNRLKHDGRGILSMANSGPNTNGSQFFITFKSCVHLDRKHSVFGHVIKGLDCLQAMEDVPTDKDDQPIDPLHMTSVEILSNPIQEAVEAEQSRKRKIEEENIRLQETRKASALGTRGRMTTESLDAATRDEGSTKQPTSKRASVGIYLKKALLPEVGTDKLEKLQNEKNFSSDSRAIDEFGSVLPSMLPPPPKKTTFKDFSGW